MEFEYRISSILNILSFAFLFAVCSPFSLLATTAVAPAQNPFKLTEEDIKMFNLSDKEVSELNTFFDGLSNLTPTQLKELDKAGQKAADDMKKKGYDPNNFDDVFKYMQEEEGGALKGLQPIPPAQPAVTPKPFEQPVAFERPVIVPVASAWTTAGMIQDLITYLNRMVTKAATRPTINRQMANLVPDIIDLGYYLNILKAPDLIQLLSSSEFSRLHRNLETLHRSLLTYEPSMVARKAAAFEEDDPYSILDVPYHATQEEIDAAYKKLEETKSPKAVEKQLKAAGLKGNALKKSIKPATRTFALIKNAYGTLKDPKKRAAADAHLTKKIELESRQESTSEAAFDKLHGALQTAFYQNGIIRDIKQLLEKYKPQELAYAQIETEKAKRAYERSKQITRVPQLPPAFQRPEGYEQFYQEMAAKAYQRPYYPGAFGPGMNHGLPQPPAQPGGPAEAAKGKKKGGKKGGKKVEGKKGPEKRQPAKGQEGVRTKDVEKLSAMGQIKDLLARANAYNDQLYVQGPEPVRGGGEAPTAEISLDDIMTNLEGSLGVPMRGRPLGAIATPEIAPVMLQRFVMQQMNMPALSDALSKVAPGPNKHIADEALKKYWVNNILNPYAPMIMAWYDKIYRHLDRTERHNKRLGGVGQAFEKKLEEYNLKGPNPELWKTESAQGKGQQPQTKQRAARPTAMRSASEQARGPIVRAPTRSPVQGPRAPVARPNAPTVPTAPQGPGTNPQAPTGRPGTRAPIIRGPQSTEPEVAEPELPETPAEMPQGREGQANLGEVKDAVYKVYNYFKNISEAFGIRENDWPKQPILPKKEKEEKEEAPEAKEEKEEAEPNPEPAEAEPE